jgi:hypothetical protein
MPVNDSDIVECRAGAENTPGAAFARGWHLVLQNGCAIRQDSGAPNRKPFDQQLARCPTVRNPVLAPAGRIPPCSTSRVTRGCWGAYARAAVCIACVHTLNFSLISSLCTSLYLPILHFLLHRRLFTILVQKGFPLVHTCFSSSAPSPPVDALQ